VTYAGADWQIDGQLNPYPPDPWYDPNTHSYVWELGEICENDSVCLDIEVEVNTASEPGMELLNVAELTAYICRSIPDPNEYAEPNSVITICGTELIARSMETTPVCCWGDYTAVYVDQYATGSGDSGTSWVDAYSGTDGLSKALYRATHSSCTGPYTIYIASGNYFPGEKEEDSFVLPEGTQIYGGFPSGGCDFSVRNPKVYEALLSGQVDDDWFSEINNIVTMGHNSLLDGVMITRAKECGIYGNTVNFSIKNCVIKENERYGVYALNGNVSIERCKIQENERDGIYHSGTNFTLDVTNSWVMRNGRFGVNCTLSTPNIKNSIVSESDMKEQGSEGVRIVEPAGLPVLYNNTIANNKGAGLFFTKTGVTDPNDHVEVKNCILY
ncbi:MAG: right-handed parallel beta-helix repeat-containing protein, partial [Sedimentisphaerales bacterium]|nr:right-handed parallel beta-helix repeat-containing protein [Sedimentisphaerales bacterium]